MHLGRSWVRRRRLPSVFWRSLVPPNGQLTLAAWRELLDRAHGKAPAFAVVEAEDPLELNEIAREIQAIADELSARRQTNTARS